jgi:hypothetical protein
MLSSMGERDASASPAVRRWRGRAAVVVAVVLVGLAGVLVWAGADGDGAGRPGGDTAGTEVPESPPADFVAVTEDGTLIRVAVGSGAIEELANFGDPRSPGDPEAGPTFIESATLAPDGSVYFVRCCEPAVGSVFLLGSPADASSRRFDGSPIAVRADGRMLAIGQGPTGIVVQRPDGSDQRWIALGTTGTQVTRLAFDGAGDTLVAGFDHGPEGPTVGVFEPTADDLADLRRLEPPPRATWSDPSPGPEGIYVVESDDAGARSVRSVTVGGVRGQHVDLEGGSPRAIDADGSGGWLLVALDRGGVAIVGPDGDVRSTIDTPPLRSVDW